MRKVLVLAASLSVISPLFAADPAPVPYPTGYRQWTHVKSMTIDQGHPLYDAFGGIHHLYANKRALQGYKTGQFADGSVIVFDLLEAKAADNTVQEGARKVLGVMHKDSQKYQDTGGWGFEGFKGDSKIDRAVGKNAATACFQCHIAQRNHDYVFSTFRK
ncbi:MAG TPA: cytochrome P460 family protein [Burkholderiaceae bacterium]|nr:cytochrome P460 family protein [Burkholderiaceae bacterium]